MSNPARLRCRLVVCCLLSPALALAQGVNIDHKGVGCVVAEKFPRFDARLDPADLVARARLHFRPEGGPHWYFVDMKPEAGLFSGVLPKPQKTLRRFSYYIDVTDRSFNETRTAEFVPDVASGPAACGREKVLAASLAKAKVLVHAPEGLPGASAVPAGFASEGVVTAGGLGPTALIVGGVVVAGGTAAVIATSKDEGSSQPQAPPPTTPPAAPATPAPPPTPPPAPNLTGTWIGNRPNDGAFLTFAGCGFCTNTPTTNGSDILLNLSQSGSSLSGNGTLTVREAPPAGCPAEPNCTQGPIGAVIPASVTGTVSGTSVTMEWTGAPPGQPGGTFLVVFIGTVAVNRMSGTVTLTATETPPAAGTWAVNLQ